MVTDPIVYYYVPVSDGGNVCVACSVHPSEVNQSSTGRRDCGGVLGHVPGGNASCCFGRVLSFTFCDPSTPADFSFLVFFIAEHAASDADGPPYVFP